MNGKYKPLENWWPWIVFISLLLLIFTSAGCRPSSLIRSVSIRGKSSFPANAQLPQNETINPSREAVPAAFLESEYDEYYPPG